MDTKLSAVLFGLLCTLAIGVSAQQTVDSRALTGGGSWKTDGAVKQSVQQWSLDLQRGRDGAVSGAISVAGSPLLGNGRVRGKFDGRVITGTIVDARGDQVAQFNGLLTRTGFHGKYVDRTGEIGEWEWEGELPER